MSASHQEFNSTASLMLDGKEPPSTTSEVKLSFAGDVIGEFLEYCIHVGVCCGVCVCVCRARDSASEGFSEQGIQRARESASERMSE